VGRELRRDLEALAAWLGVSGIVEPRRGNLTI
jgi:hypothetical protein